VDDQLTVRALLRFVPDDMQELAIYYFVDQMSQDEIAGLTGIPRRTIGYQLGQFRARARAILMTNDGPQRAAGRPSSRVAKSAGSHVLEG
jgi:DNA-directed RNA polymerase specialized sigma24 family protein